MDARRVLIVEGGGGFARHLAALLAAQADLVVSVQEMTRTVPLADPEPFVRNAPRRRQAQWKEETRGRSTDDPLHHR